MNAKIRELAEQVYGMDVHYDDGVFAELIIKECINVINPEGDLTSMREEYGRKLSMNMLKQHFGVE